MDPLRLLSRSTKASQNQKQSEARQIPSRGPTAEPQLFSPNHSSSNQESKKRKRGLETPGLHEDKNNLNFFDDSIRDKNVLRRAQTQEISDLNHERDAEAAQEENLRDERTFNVQSPVELKERKHILKQHKIKVTWLNSTASQPRSAKGKRNGKIEKAKSRRVALLPRAMQSFGELRQRFGISSRLMANTIDQGYTTPTEVQLAALPLLLEDIGKHQSETDTSPDMPSGSARQPDLMTVAPTGSGKTLAFMIPLLQSLLNQRQIELHAERHVSAIVLAPTKELTNQIVNEGRKLCQGTGLKISQLRKGMTLSQELPDDDDSNIDGPATADEQREPTVKSDIIVSTPGLLQSCTKGSNTTSDLSEVKYLVLDEADVLLDPLFRDQTFAVWDSLDNPELRISMWSATMASNVEELAISTIRQRSERLASENGIGARPAPLLRLVVGLKDSAIPHIQHNLTYAATEQGKLMGLRQLLHPTSSSVDSGPPLIPPFLVFTQTIERAIALHAELLYDIPVEAGGINRVAVLHSDLSDFARDSVMTRFRKGEIWVLITTDLLSRGVDFRGVNGVVNYDLPTSSAAYVHRVGRTGRANREGGVAVTLYSKEDIPYLKHVVNVISMAQKQDSEGNSMQQWLLDALPNLNKNEKQKLKRRGIESRTSRGKQSNPKAARKARISTKAGFVRQSENRLKGAIRGSQKRMEMEVQSEGDDESDFAGFD